jgi:hypothetical protein
LRRQAEQQAELSSENQRPSHELAQVKKSAPLADTQLSELMRLRGEVAALRNQKSSPGRSHQTGAKFQSRLDAPTVPLLPPDKWANVGTATPEATWQTLRWAFIKQDTNTFAQAAAWDPEVKGQAQALFDAAPDSTRQKFGSVDDVLRAMIFATHGETNISGFGVVSQDINGDDATLIVQEQHTDGQVKQNPIPLHRFDDGWRVLTPPKMLGALEGFLNNPGLWPKDSTGAR